MQRKAILAGVSAFALLVGGASVASAQDSVTASVYHDLYGNKAVDNGSTRTNDVDNSFNNASGIITIQENNGSSNAIGAANAVQVNMASNNDLNADAYVYQKTFYNFTVADTGTRDNDITNSFNNSAGIVTVQQNNGDNNVMGVATAVHTRVNEGVDFGDVDQEVKVYGATAAQKGVAFGPGLYYGVLDNDQLRDNDITDSFNNSSGIASVQQNNGTGNAIGAANSVAVDVGGVDTDNPGDPGKNVNQHVYVTGELPGSAVVDLTSDRTNSITESFNGSAGIANVQQNNGDVNVMGIGNAVMANLGLPEEEQLNNDVDQKVEVEGIIKGAKSFDVDLAGDPVNGARANDITGSFDDASGIANVQQNNGSQNIMGIGNAVQANLDSVVDDLNGDDDVDQVANTVGGDIGNSAQSHAFGLNSDAGSHRRNDITNSFDGFSGLANVQQNNGDNNVIGSSNAVVAAIRTDDVVDDVDESSANTWAKVAYNRAKDEIPGGPNDGSNRRNEINGSFGGAQGILNVQQNNGNNNVMGIANTVTANVNNNDADSADDASTFSDATAYVFKNRATADAFVDRDNELNNSFNGAAGLVNVQQNNGDNNAMNSSNAVAASLNNDPVDGFGGFTVSAATLSATVAGNVSIIDATAEVGGFNNSVTGSGTNFSGIAVIQQNNGNNNSIQSSNSVVANIGNFAGGNFLGGLNQ